MLLGIKISYHALFELVVILLCYSFMISKLIIALKCREYGAVRIQLLLLLIATVLVGYIYII